MDKICTGCRETKDLTAFYDKVKNGKRFKASECKKCSISRSMRYKKTNKMVVNKSNRDGYDRARDKFLIMYGNVCACCEETERAFLTVDHIKGQAGMKRETSRKAYSNAAKEYNPSKYRILCHNCNHATRFGICPHKTLITI